jgi:hypothetical protein
LRPAAGFIGRGVALQSADTYRLYHENIWAQVKPETLADWFDREAIGRRAVTQTYCVAPGEP